MHNSILYASSHGHGSLVQELWLLRALLYSSSLSEQDPGQLLGLGLLGGLANILQLQSRF